MKEILETIIKSLVEDENGVIITQKKMKNVIPLK